MDSPTDWLASRTPTAPDEMKAWLTIADVVTESPSRAVAVPGLLVEAGLVHLDKAVARLVRDREAAHDLLAADALITYACEAAGEEADVHGALYEILGRVRTGDEGA
jgi:hypothetical protein